MARARTCAKCGSHDLKVYPDDFAGTTWPFTLTPLSVRIAGGPDPTRPILVCTGCGHNEDLPQRLP